MKIVRSKRTLLFFFVSFVVFFVFLGVFFWVFGFLEVFFFSFLFFKKLFLGVGGGGGGEGTLSVFTFIPSFLCGKSVRSWCGGSTDRSSIV